MAGKEVNRDADLTEDERHAIAHARYQVERATPDKPECAFDYELVRDLLRVIDRQAASVKGEDAQDEAPVAWQWLSSSGWITLLAQTNIRALQESGYKLRPLYTSPPAVTGREELERVKANHRDVVAVKRSTDARLRIALSALQKIYDESCEDNISLIAGEAFNKATDRSLPVEQGRADLMFLRNDIQRHIFDGHARDISPYDVATNILLFIQAALSQAPASDVQTSWQPIETAPLWQPMPAPPRSSTGTAPSLCQVCGEAAPLRCGPSRFGDQTWACERCWNPDGGVVPSAHQGGAT